MAGEGAGVAHVVQTVEKGDEVVVRSRVVLGARDSWRRALGDLGLDLARNQGDLEEAGQERRAVVIGEAESLLFGQRAFRVDAVLAVCGLLVAAFFVGGDVDLERLAGLRHHHRAHA